LPTGEDLLRDALEELEGIAEHDLGLLLVLFFCKLVHAFIPAKGSHHVVNVQYIPQQTGAGECLPRGHAPFLGLRLFCGPVPGTEQLLHSAVVNGKLVQARLQIRWPWIIDAHGNTKQESGSHSKLLLFQVSGGYKGDLNDAICILSAFFFCLHQQKNDCL
jgi:hypothetical protein